MAIGHNLGFPRIGAHREMKKAVEAYWRGELSEAQLKEAEKQIQLTNWNIQAQAGIDFIPVGDFTWYDHVLDHSFMFGCIPDRFAQADQAVTLDTYFCMARGQAPNGQEASACEMTKWFDTNYHYIVPEFKPGQSFHLASEALFQKVDQALASGHRVKPVLLGPLTYLWLGKTKGAEFDKLDLLDNLLAVYEQIFARLQQQNIEWVQIDEPILVLDLPLTWQQALTKAYERLNTAGLKTLLATYFGGLGNNTELACQLNVTGLHIDLCRQPEQLDVVLQHLPADKVLSAGVIDGRNVWRADLAKKLRVLQPLHADRADLLWVGSSCSLLHVPVDLDEEHDLDAQVKSWLAFSKQKVHEIALLTRALNQGESAIAQELADSEAAVSSRQHSNRTHNPAVRDRLANLPASWDKRQNPYAERAKAQNEALNLPLFPTTTIGSFPQTQAIRKIRHAYRKGQLDEVSYQQQIKAQIAEVVKKQEDLGLDVLVHGEAERNDMVEYFGEHMDGFVFTRNGWVQSYGSRCVKPPIIYGDVQRPNAMTVEWIQYAQSLTDKPMKGMLTGPVTILFWSFVRDDQPRADTCLQIALALRDEVNDLEAGGINIIQIDEPAFREGLPLLRNDWQAYLAWAVRCFRISSSGVKDTTQIHSHMCYSEFNDIIEAIADLDADVISIESSRSDMELLKAFQAYDYPNEIGPGVYDIHSPRVPSEAEMADLLEKAKQYIPVKHLWVNPDCGLKTRSWPEVEQVLANMVNAANAQRESYTDS